MAGYSEVTPILLFFSSDIVINGYICSLKGYNFNVDGVYTYQQVAPSVRCKKDRLLSFLLLSSKLGIHTIFWSEFRLIVASC